MEYSLFQPYKNLKMRHETILFLTTSNNCSNHLITNQSPQSKCEKIHGEHVLNIAFLCVCRSGSKTHVPSGGGWWSSKKVKCRRTSRVSTWTPLAEVICSRRTSVIRTRTTCTCRVTLLAAPNTWWVVHHRWTASEIRRRRAHRKSSTTSSSVINYRLIFLHAYIIRPPRRVFVLNVWREHFYIDCDDRWLYLNFTL
jgi:hypothetical protein